MKTLLTGHRKGIVTAAMILSLMGVGLMVRLGYLMLLDADQYYLMAQELHQRERRIKAARGTIYDANGVPIATNKTVCTVSVVHSQVTDPETVIRTLTDKLGLEETEVRKKVEKRSSREVIRTNVEKDLGDEIRECDMAGVKVDEDYKRYYPYGSLASKVLGFTGSDNQGIIGLEVAYESVLKGTDGTILTLADAAGREIENAAEERVEPVAGKNLHLSLDVNVQKYLEQAAEKLMIQKQAKQASGIVMNPKTGEILAMVNVPEFDLNDPYSLPEGTDTSQESAQDLLNKMWRNAVINDTYEPGSTFKIITAAAGLDSGAVTPESTFSCPGFYVVEDRRIRCHKTTGHGAETFVQGTMNSCNPVFIQVGLRMGVDVFYSYFERFGLLKKTGIDLPGEASTIMHKPENMGEVELATVSFGQSFQITPLQLITTASAIINGGRRVTPHFGVSVQSADGSQITKLQYPVEEGVLSEETSAKVRSILEQVVAEGSGKNGAVEGYRIGGKTATSEKLPRRTGKYISSFIGFAPADDPEVITLMTVDEPVGVYYGGTIVAPVVAEFYENILPYLGVEKSS